MRVPDFKHIVESGPVYAVIGANSLVAEKIRQLPGDLERLQADVEASIRDLPGQVSRYATGIGDRTTLLYADLVDRGQRLASSRRGEEPPSAPQGDGS